MDDVVQAALARNDRYLREFVEALNICPFTQRTRDEGRLERRVLLGRELDTAVTLQEIDRLRSSEQDVIEVALLIFPETTTDYVTFERFATTIRERHDVQDAENGFFVVDEEDGRPTPLTGYARHGAAHGSHRNQSFR